MAMIHQLIQDVFLASVIPEFFIIIWLSGLIALSTLKICLFLCAFIFIVLPLVFKHSVALQRGILFLTFVKYPANLTYEQPELHGLYASRNLYISYDDPEEKTTINVGVWHVLPNYVAKHYATALHLSETEKFNLTNTVTPATHHPAFNQPISSGFSSINKTNRNEFFEQMLVQATPGIILYLHGNSNSRGASHRIELYQVLRELGYHILALDYRSYGDSTKVSPSEIGVVRDAISVYNYITSITKNPVFLWGHSLGTGIATHMLSLLAKNNVPGPRALVLESPFNNINEEIRAHPMSKLFRNLPWFEYTIARPMHSNFLRFESDQHISEFRQPVMILHAEDDMVVPFKLGYKLYRAALDTRGKTWGPVEFHRFDAANHFGHKYICRSVELPHLVSNFYETYRKEYF